MINKPYADYFQKSQVFLFPLTGIPKLSPFVPLSTHLSWRGVYAPKDRKLMVVYDTLNDCVQWQEFLSNLFKNFHFELVAYTPDRKKAVVILDMRIHEDTYVKVLRGTYSKIEAPDQSLVMTFFGVRSGEWAYIDTFFKPQKYMKLYAELYGVEEEAFSRHGELCEMPNPEKECLKLITEINVDVL
jgi:hypothetical protein